MSTLHGSISKLTGSSKAAFDSLAHISSNIANYNTHCYKTERFEFYMNAGDAIRGVVRRDHSQGSLIVTYNALDVALDGAGFIPVTDKKGDVSYIRGGSFKINSEGYIISADGKIVGSGIKVPPNYKRIKINPNGDFMLQNNNESEFQKIGKIPVVTFNNPEGLEFCENNCFKESDESGKPELLSEHLRIKQGQIERANFDPYNYVGKTLQIGGSIISCSRFIQTLNDMYRQAINLRT